MHAKDSQPNMFQFSIVPRAYDYRMTNDIFIRTDVKAIIWRCQPNDLTGCVF